MTRQNNYAEAKGFMMRLRANLNTNEMGESLLGTMLGVLLLSVMTASFAGVIFASASASNRAGETSDRVSLVNSYTADAQSDLRVEKNERPTGWSAPTNPSPAFTYNAVLPSSSTNPVVVQQWGRVDNNVVTIYTAMQRPGSTVDCSAVTQGSSAESRAVLKAGCVVSYSTSPTTLTAPPANPTSANVNWRSYVNIFPWVDSVDRSTSTGLSYAATPAVVNPNAVTYAVPAAGYGRQTFGAAATTTNGGVQNNAIIPVVANQVYRVSAVVRPNVAKSLQVAVIWNSATTPTFGATTFSATANNSIRLTDSFTAPAGATTLQIAVVASASNAWASGNILDIDGASVSLGATDIAITEGSPNLLTNGNLTNSSVGWVNRAGGNVAGNTPAALTWVPAATSPFTTVVVPAVTSATGFGRVQFGTGMTTASIIENITAVPVTAGAQHRVSLYVRSDVARTVKLQVTWTGGVKAAGATTYSLTANTWTRIADTFSAPANATSMTVAVIPVSPTVFATTNIIDVDGYAVTAGTADLPFTMNTTGKAGSTASLNLAKAANPSIYDASASTLLPTGWTVATPGTNTRFTRIYEATPVDTVASTPIKCVFIAAPRTAAQNVAVSWAGGSLNVGLAVSTVDTTQYNTYSSTPITIPENSNISFYSANATLKNFVCYNNK